MVDEGCQRQWVLREFVAIRIPTRDRDGKRLPATKRNFWIAQLKHFLLNDLKLTGLEKDEVKGIWRGDYDPETGQMRIVEEKVLIVKGFCTPEQLAQFGTEGRDLLVKMGKALRQQAVAFETREGLWIIPL